MTATPTEPTTTQPVPAQGPPTPPKVDETDWKAEARKHEARAKEYKAAADELATIKQANLTEAEKTAQRITTAEAEVAKVPAKVADALRDSIIALGIIPEDKKVLLTASDPESLLAQIKAIQGLTEDRKKRGGYVSREGSNAQSGGDDPLRAVARGLFKPAD